MKKIYLTCCFGLDHDLVLLERFCQHYINLGINPNNFLLVLNTSNNRSSNIINALNLLSKYKIEPLDIWCTRYESEEKWLRVHNLLSKYVSPEDWVVHPDADEFHEIPFDNYNLFFNSLEGTNINAGQGIQLDRLSQDFKVSNTNYNDNIFDEFPVMTNITNAIGCAGVKLMFYKGSFRANNGSGQIHRNCKNSVFYYHKSNTSLESTLLGKKYLLAHGNTTDCFYNLNSQYNTIKEEFNLIVHHFKWHGQVIEKLKERIQTYTLLNRPQVNQSVRVLSHYENNNKFVLKDK